MSQSVQDLLPYLREALFCAGFTCGAVLAVLFVIVWRQR